MILIKQKEKPNENTKLFRKGLGHMVQSKSRIKHTPANKI